MLMLFTIVILLIPYSWNRGSMSEFSCQLDHNLLAFVLELLILLRWPTKIESQMKHSIYLFTFAAPICKMKVIDIG